MYAEASKMTQCKYILKYSKSPWKIGISNENKYPFEVPIFNKETEHII